LDIYISSPVKEKMKDAVALANEYGVNLEICKFAEAEILDGDLQGTIKEFLNILKDFQGKLSLHGTFYDLNPASRDPKIREVSVYRYRQSLQIAKALNVKTIVFHTGFNSFGQPPLIFPERFVSQEILFWKEFIKDCEDSDIIIALENTCEPSVDILCTIIENVNSSHFKACIDAGHVNIASSERIIDWIDKIGTNLHHMHLHNNYGHNDNHNSLLDGIINFNEIFKTLKNKKLNPNLIIEVFNDKNAIESIKFVEEQFKLIEIA